MARKSAQWASLSRALSQALSGFKMAFNHEKLEVYQRALVFDKKASNWTGEWGGRHAIRDHLDRAASSIVENLAMSSASHTSMKTRCLDYSVGSTLECAACMDLAEVKHLLNDGVVARAKEDLLHILRMLIGLRRSWSCRTSWVRESDAVYEAREKALFHHEKLDVYKVSMQIAKTLTSSETVDSLPATVFRRLDELLTSMVLNIAEGNGRFSKADQQRFIGVSHEAAIKLAARLDICVVQELIPADEVQEVKLLLERVAAMTLAMSADM